MQSELRTETRDDGIVTLWLHNPKRSVVVLDSWLLDQLHLFFDRLESGPTPAGLIVMSASAKVFVAGADLAEIDALDDEQLHAYLTEGAEALARISALACPTVAAINGAALGGGLELAMHCDGLIAARPAPGPKPYQIGLPEASLGICPAWGGTQMLPARIEPGHAIQMMASGRTCSLDELPPGLIERTVENEDDLYEAAVHWIENAEKPGVSETPLAIDDWNSAGIAAGLERVRAELPDTPAAHAVVEAVEIGIEDGFAAGLSAERRLLVSLRHTPAARERIAAFFARNA